ncbi:MAG TPA: DUF4276 family protein [Candidatus Deferrimicrobiaceae bacterium]|mgnify:CR=1 FL=1|nr:DUF4276 family protein [Candidatus Deferrimicrobiaceae bacterium]
MHLEILVEEASAEAALVNLLPRIIEDTVAFAVRTFRGKRDLLSKLPDRLRGYRATLPSDGRIVVLVDEDRSDCMELKARLEEIAKDAGFVTKTAARRGRKFQVVNRLAIEELEAWFFGDVKALVQAYPGVPGSLDKKAAYRDPDAIEGGTWEALERVLRKAGYYPGGLPKIEVAKTISIYMDPGRNTSQSFRVFCEGVRAPIP